MHSSLIARTVAETDQVDGQGSVRNMQETSYSPKKSKRSIHRKKNILNHLYFLSKKLQNESSF